MASEHPLRVAVVGSGPAGFYAAGALLASEDPIVEVDVFDRLPTPWGLVRLGVAPDHPKIKSVSRAFERIAQRPRFRFFGNVEVGSDLGHGELMELYDAVIYAFGAQADRRMGIPGEDLPGSWPATAFVAWYNGHPDFQEIPFDLSSPRAVVVGNGNVAVDVARMLALTAGELAPTDTTDEAIAAIVGSGIDEILVLGRRGPAQAAFTPPELQELTELEGADLVIDPADLELDPASAAALEDDTAVARRNVDLLHAAAGSPAAGKPKALRLRFCVSPVAILGDERVEAVEVVRNELVADESGRISRRGHRRPGGDSLRDRAAERRLPRYGHARCAVRRGQRDDQERGRSRARRRGRADPGGVLHRLDQARPERSDRHEQEGCDRDGGPRPRGRARRPASRSRRPAARDGSRTCSPRAVSRSSPMRAGRRSTPSSASAESGRGGRG